MHPERMQDEAGILTAPPGPRVSDVNLSRPGSRDSFEGSCVVPRRAGTQGLANPLCCGRPGNPGFGAWGPGRQEVGGLDRRKLWAAAWSPSDPDLPPE